MTYDEFSRALTLTELDPASRSVRAAYRALVLGETGYRASKYIGITQPAVTRVLRRIRAAHELQTCPKCGQPLHPNRTASGYPL